MILFFATYYSQFFYDFVFYFGSVANKEGISKTNLNGLKLNFYSVCSVFDLLVGCG